MPSDLIPAVAQAHPLQTRALYREMHAGATIAEIVASFDLPDRFGLPIVQMIRGGSITTVPLDMWAHVRPKPGTRVEIGYAVEGPAAALIATVAFSAAAPWVAGTAFGLTVGTLAYSLTVAAVSIVGGLVINALIPPVQPQEAAGTRRTMRFSALATPRTATASTPRCSAATASSRRRPRAGSRRRSARTSIFAGE